MRDFGKMGDRTSRNYNLTNGDKLKIVVVRDRSEELKAKRKNLF